MFITNYKNFNLDFFEDMLQKGWREKHFAEYFEIPIDKLPEEMKKKFGNLPTNSIYGRFFTAEVEGNVNEAEATVPTSVSKTRSEELKQRLNDLDIIINDNHKIIYESIPNEARRILKELRVLQSRLKDLKFEEFETMRYLSSCYHEKDILSQELEELNAKFVTIYIAKDGSIETDENKDEPILDFTGSDELISTLIASESLEHLTVKQIRALSKLIVLDLKHEVEYQLVFEDAELEDFYKKLLLKK